MWGMQYIIIVAVFLLLAVLSITYFRFRAEISETRERVLAGSELLKTDHGDIEYAVKGEGPPVLLLHGSGGGYDQGLLLGKQVLGNGFKLISVSRFGFLRTPMPEDSSVEAQAALYTALLDYLKIKKVIVIAGSGGGPSALQFAHDYPDRCSALILVSAMSMSMIETFPIKVVHLIQKSDFVYWMFAKFFQSQLLKLIGTPPEVCKEFTPEEKELISAPTLILHAKDDKLVNYKHAEFAYRNIKQSKLISFEDGGHGLLAQFKEVRGYVRIFLSAV